MSELLPPTNRPTKEDKAALRITGLVLIACVAILLVTIVVMVARPGRADAQTPPETPNCVLAILDPLAGGMQISGFDQLAVPFDAVLPNSPLQPGMTITVLLHKPGCPQVGMTLYSHPDNAPGEAHPGSIVAATAVHERDGINGLRTLTLTVPADFNPCGYQLDLYRGGEIVSFRDGDRYGPRLIDWLRWVNPDPNCNPVEPTTTTTPTPTTEPPTTVPDTTTPTTDPEQPSTTVPDPSTTLPDSTTIPDPTTSTVPDSTTTTVTVDQPCIYYPGETQLRDPDTGQYCSTTSTPVEVAQLSESTSRPESLPHTGAPIMLIAGLGLSLLGSGHLLRRFARRNG